PPRRAPPRGRPASLAAPPPGRSAAGAPPLPRRPGGGPDPPQRFRAQVAPRRETHPPKPPYPHWDPTATRRPWLRILAPVHHRVQQADDLLLPRGGRVKLVAHPSESAAHFGKPVIDLRPQVRRILAHRVEHARVLFPESPDLRTHLGHVAIRRQPARGRTTHC